MGQAKLGVVANAGEACQDSQSANRRGAKADEVSELDFTLCWMLSVCAETLESHPTAVRDKQKLQSEDPSISDCVFFLSGGRPIVIVAHSHLRQFFPSSDIP
jgi:hypothetical protein